MKILYINPSAGLGGAERSLLDIISAVRKTAPEFELHLLVTDDGPLIRQATQLGVSVCLLPLPTELAEIGDSKLSLSSSKLEAINFLFSSAQSLISLGRYTQQLRKAIQFIQPDLIHSNGFKTHLLTTLAGLPVPTIWHIRDFVSSRRIVSHALRWASGRAIAIANSQAVGQDLQKAIPRLPVEVVYNAIDIEHFSPGWKDSQLLDSLVDLPQAQPDTLRIGLIATFARWKGQDIFLKAASRLVESGVGSPMRFYIIGGPIYQTKGSQFSLQELQDRAASLGISNFVGFTGFQQNTADIYRALDIVVHASTQPEPFGRTIVEGMACGKPVIVSQAGGASELFTHNYDAVGVQPGDSTALASAIQYLIENPNQRQRLSENARESVLKRFSHDRLGQEIIGAYKRFKGCF